jgi:penicillin-binding protein-related factor A (putative recombinase)|tara:strand:+ start:10527 stop:11189 length:663 start_codon:yes stop_codon:yes gene_type:complete
MFKHTLVEFDELETVTEDKKRFYLTPEGNKYPSVTTVCSLATVDGIKKWRKRVGNEQANKISSKASSRGTKVHKLVEDYVNNKDLDFDDVLPVNLFMFKQIKPILDTYLENVYAIECPLYSDYLETAGRVDCIGTFKGKPAIIDFKTANKRKQRSWIHNYFMQEAAYAVMFEERTKIPISRIVTVIAVEQDEPQLFIEKRDDYINLFQQYRTLYKEKYSV